MVCLYIPLSSQSEHVFNCFPNQVTTPPPDSDTNRKAQIILALLRLFLIEQYTQRRDSLNRSPSNTRMMLQHISVLLVHTRRLEEIEIILNTITENVKQSGLDAEVEYWITNRRIVGTSEMGQSALRIFKGNTELGGRAVLRIGA